MKVKISYLSILRDATGVKEEEIEIPECSTVNDLIHAIMEKYGDDMRHFLDPDSEMGQGIILTLNGELLSSSDLKREIPANAEFLVGLPPFGG